MATKSSLIENSVGARGGNKPADIKKIEYLFNIVGCGSKFSERGICTQELIGAITRFQKHDLKFPHPDGRIDPGGKTLSGLLERARKAPKQAKPVSGSLPIMVGGAWQGAGVDVQKLFGLLGFAAKSQAFKKEDQVDFSHRAVVDSHLLLRDKHSQSNKINQTALLKSVGSISKLTPADFDSAAKSLGAGISTAIIRAFAEVESGGRSGFGPEGLPVIAFEGHIFRKLTGKKYDTTHPRLSYKYVKKAGPEWQANNADQKTAWNTLRQAIELDSDAALQSCSWGMFQVMGFNYKGCGFASVDEFVASMKAGERGQLDAFVGFCKSSNALLEAMRANNFAKMAELYNGADYGNYDVKIKNAFEKYSGK